MTEQERIDAACHRLMSDPAMRPLVQWWEATALRVALPPGPIDPLRLAMAQGDRERLLQIMQRAGRSKAEQEKTP